MYLVYQIGGWPLQRNVWSYVEGANNNFLASAGGGSAIDCLLEEESAPARIRRATLC